MRFTFSGAQSGAFTAAGLRAVVSIQAFRESLGNQAQVKIWGLTLDQMNNYSSFIPAAVASQMFKLKIEAGDLDGQLSQVLNGLILRSFIDLSGVPESAFVVTAINTYLQSTPIASQSQPGAQNAEDLIAQLCPQGGLTFDNSAGAHAVLRNPHTYGSVTDQIKRIATAAKFNWKINGTTLSLWPKGGSVDDVVIEIGPSTDPEMVGYPSYWEAGIIVTSLYNPEIQPGRQMKVTSTIPKANGLWSIIQVQHDLTTMLPKGPWFTTAVLAPIGS